MTDAPSLLLTYLGGCPGHTRAEPVTVMVFEDRFEIQAKSWGWRIGLGSVRRVGETQPAPGGETQMAPVVWSPGTGQEMTLLLAGDDARRLRFLLAQAVARDQLAADLPAPSPAPPAASAAPARGRYVGPWARELRRMRAVTLAAGTVALAALVLVFGVAIVLVGRGATASHWVADRDAVTQKSRDVQFAADVNPSGLTAALDALVQECQRLEGYNGDTKNEGDDFTEVQRICSGVGVVLY